jgi:hypothetical protein
MVNSGQWKAFRKRFVREAALENRACALCGGEIDYEASGRSRFGPQVDHILAVERGGAMYDRHNCQISHAMCNGSKAAALDPRRGGGSVRRQLPADRVPAPAERVQQPPDA